MKLETNRFGEIEIAEEDIINFEEGLPGFPDDKKFVLLTEDDNPIAFLQSADDAETSFVVIDMVAVMTDYDPLVDENLLESLGKLSPQSLLVFNICTIDEDLKKSTVNLKAPIIINAENKKGKQVVCNNEEYSVKAPMFKEGEPC